LHHGAPAVLRQAARDLRRAGCPDPEASAFWMLSAATRLPAARLRRDPVLTDEALSLFEGFVERRKEREPVQYIVGDWDFLGLTLQCRAPVLIPRPETEVLVKAIIEHYGSEPPERFLDVGCGSGAISLALLDAWPHTRGVALDISPDALQLTQDNAELLGMADRLEILSGDASQGFPEGEVQMVVSNPPYVATEEMRQIERELHFEDPAALDGGDDGLELARHIVQHASGCLAKGEQLWMELGEGHPAKLELWLGGSSQYGMAIVRKFEDLEERNRFCSFIKID